jgi:soluble lytic murein transglycosylase
MEAYGDPRNSSVDPIDWIEHIPFEETRNYVMRVIENMEVYRDRLSGRSEPLRIMADIYKPNAPQAGPLHYTPSARAESGGAADPSSSAVASQGNAPAKSVMQPVGNRR